MRRTNKMITKISKMNMTCLSLQPKTSLFPTIQPLWRTVWRFLKKLAVKLPYCPAVLLLGIYFEETITEKDKFILTFIATLFTIVRAWKQPRWASTDEWIRKLRYIYTMEYYSAIKKNSFESVLMRGMKLEPII